MKTLTMGLPPAPLEDWMREFYFDVDFDIGSSGVQEYSLADIRRLTGLELEELDRQIFCDSRTLGAPGLREAIADRFLGGRVDSVIVTHGATEANFLVMRALLEPGNEVVVLEPLYRQLSAIAESQGCRLRCWRLRPEHGWSPDFEELEELLSEHTRAVVVNFPHNPTGITLSRAEQLRLIGLCAKHGTYLVWDGAFTELTYDEAPLPEPGLDYERAVSMGTLSKAYGLPGLRIGWCLAPPELMPAFVRLRDYLTLHLSPLVEKIAECVLRHGDRFVHPRLEQAQANRELVRAWIERHSPALSWVPPRGGVSSFVRLAGGASSEELCRRLAGGDRVMLVPGECFGWSSHVRLGFGCAGETLRGGLERWSRLLGADRGTSHS